MRTRVWLLGAGALVAIAASSPRAEPDPLQRPALHSPRARATLQLGLARAGDRLVAVGEHGIALLSDDQGMTWRQAQVPVSVTLTKVGFASSHRGWAIGQGGIVLRTDDGGSTWSTEIAGPEVAALVLGEAVQRSRSDPDERAELAAMPLLDLQVVDEDHCIVVGADGLVLATRDGGRHWESWGERLSNPAKLHLYGIAVSGARVVIVGEQGVMFRSEDGGATFKTIRSPYEGTWFGVLADRADGLIAYGMLGHVYASDDGGTSWRAAERPPGASVTGGTRLADGTVVLVDNGGHVLFSRDRGRSFQLDLPNAAAPLFAAAQAADGTIVVCGMRGAARWPPAGQR